MPGRAPLTPTSPLPTPAIVAFLALAAVLLFARLGHYPLWDDEACTAILARGVWETGRSLAVQDGNVMAYGEGSMLFGVWDRVHPPLQQYVMAPFLGLLGETSAWAARLPMAATGLGVVWLLCRWLRRDSPDRAFTVIFLVLLLSNVALFLYLRQARYYALGIFAMTLAAYLYTRLPERAGWRDLLPLGGVFATLPLISSQVFATFAPLFVLDYLIWGRKRSRIGASGWGALLLPPLGTSLFILATWNPLLISESSSYAGPWWYRPTMVWWAFRDLNASEMAVGALILAAPLVGWWAGRPQLVRGAFAVAAACVMEGLLDPQTPATTSIAGVRHLAPVVPLAVAVSAGVIYVVWLRSRTLAVVLLGLAGFTNVLHWGALQPGVRLRSAQYLWATELLSPPDDPYSAALRLLRNHTRPGETVGIEPDWMRYPLMFHLPDRLYTWQLHPRFAPQHAPDIDPRQYYGSEPPAWFVAFGLFHEDQRPKAEALAGRKYELTADDRNIYWRDSYRPELILRDFGRPRPFNPNYHGVYLLRLPPAPAPAPSPK